MAQTRNSAAQQARVEDDKVNSDMKAEDPYVSEGILISISELAALFLEASCSMKLDNNAWKT